MSRKNEKKKHSSSAKAVVTRDTTKWGQEPPSSQRKRLNVGVIVIVTALIIAAGSWAIYALWYQNPNKVVSDAIVNAVTAKSFAINGSMSQADDANSELVFDGKWGYSQGGKGTFKLTLDFATGNEVIVDGEVVRNVAGESYLKTANLDEVYGYLIDKVVSSSPERASRAGLIRAVYSQYLGPIINYVDDSWMKIDTVDLESTDKTYGNEFACLNEVVVGFNKNRDMLRELAGRYEQNNFIVIKKDLGTKSGNVGYVIEFDQSRTEKFAESLKTTKLYDELQACSKTGKNSLSSLSAMLEEFAKSNVRGEVWIDQWNHQFESLKFQTGSSGEADKKGTVFEATTTFNVPIGEIDTPDDSIPFRNVVDSMGQLLQAGLSTETPPVTGKSN